MCVQHIPSPKAAAKTKVRKINITRFETRKLLSISKTFHLFLHADRTCVHRTAGHRNRGVHE